MATPDTVNAFILVASFVVFFILLCCCTCGEDDRADRRAAESAQRRLAQAWAQWQASAARAEAALAARAAAESLAGKAAAAPPVLAPLPYFPYAAAHQGDVKPPSGTVVECAICLEALRPGQLCSEVPPCRHVFHRDCLGEWARSNGSCPLCRAKIVPGSDEVAIADDMV